MVHLALDLIQFSLAGRLRAIGCAAEPHDVGVTVLRIDGAEPRDTLGRQSLGLLTANLVANHVANLSSGNARPLRRQEPAAHALGKMNATYVDQAVALLHELADRPA